MKDDDPGARKGSREDPERHEGVPAPAHSRREQAGRPEEETVLLPVISERSDRAP